MVAEPRGTPWADLPPALRAELQRQSRRRQKLRRMGKPSNVPARPSILRVRELHDQGGLTFQQMQEASSLSNSTLSDLYRGTRGRGRGGTIEFIPRRTQYEVFTIPMPAMPDSHSRAQVSHIGAQRRLQALSCLGFTVKSLSESLGYADWCMVWRIIAGKAQRGTSRTFIELRTHLRIAEVYTKLAEVDPGDHGISRIGVGRAKATAVRNGYAPPWAWDDDTIDDPDAFPEWTGACGTEEGYRIHIRETLFGGRHLPLCVPCRLAVETREKAEFIWHPEEFDALLNEKGVSVRSFAKQTGMKPDPLYRWKQGRTSPRKRGDVEKIAVYFDVPVDRLISFPEPKDSGEGLTQGKFNRHVFIVALDLKGVSQSDAARLCDVSHRTVSNWVHGRRAPETPGKLTNLVRFLGVSTEVFYT